MESKVEIKGKEGTNIGYILILFLQEEILRVLWSPLTNW